MTTSRLYSIVPKRPTTATTLCEECLNGPDGERNREIIRTDADDPSGKFTYLTERVEGVRCNICEAEQEAQIGYLDPNPKLDMAQSVLCNPCAAKHDPQPTTRLFASNIHPYSQCCHKCGVMIYTGPAPTILFGKRPTDVPNYTTGEKL